jgi:hypothetical protein
LDDNVGTPSDVDQLSGRENSHEWESSLPDRRDVAFDHHLLLGLNIRPTKMNTVIFLRAPVFAAHNLQIELHISWSEHMRSLIAQLAVRQSVHQRVFKLKLE